MTMTKEEFEEQLGKALDLQSNDRIDESLELLYQLEETGIRQAAVQGMIGSLLYLRKGDAAKAMKYLKKATDVSPRSEMASVSLFHALFDMGKTDGAFDEMRRFTAITDSEEYRRILDEINASG
jgi:predicted Zn-dependent protease